MANINSSNTKAAAVAALKAAATATPAAAAAINAAIALDGELAYYASAAYTSHVSAMATVGQINGANVNYTQVNLK